MFRLKTAACGLLYGQAAEARETEVGGRGRDEGTGAGEEGGSTEEDGHGTNNGGVGSVEGRVGRCVALLMQRNVSASILCAPGDLDVWAVQDETD